MQSDAQPCKKAEAVEPQVQKQCTSCNGHKSIYSPPSRNFARVWFTGTGVGSTRNALFGNVTLLTAECRLEELNCCSELANCSAADAQQPEPVNRTLSWPAEPLESWKIPQSLLAAVR